MLDVVGRDDKIAVYKYDAKLEALSDFKQGHEALDSVFDHLSAPESSEANFYDALLEILNRMQEVGGRKAIIALSTGVDTFSKATFEQTLEAARESDTPVYAIGLGAFAQLEASLYGPQSPFARIDWNGAEERLEQLARASGGRAYEPKTYLEVPAIYDDVMENLRVRYVITYVSSNAATSGPPRNVRVDLIDPSTGAPLTVRDSSGNTTAPKVFVQGSYTPVASSGG
jgi:VWFA-related protein